MAVYNSENSVRNAYALRKGLDKPEKSGCFFWIIDFSTIALKQIFSKL
jgi:hypothetical protein